MASFQELVERSLATASGATKMASQKMASATNVDEEINSIAMGLGLDLGFGKEAGDDDKDDDKEDKKEDKDDDDKGATKEAFDLGGIFDTMFPEESGLSVKTAEQEKIAYQTVLGARAHDHFSDRFDRRVEKIASEMMSGSIHKDTTPPQSFPNNKAADAGSAVDLKPVVTDNVKAKNDAETVGHYEQKTAAAAMRKALILAQLEE